MIQGQAGWQRNWRRDIEREREWTQDEVGNEKMVVILLDTGCDHGSILKFLIISLSQRVRFLLDKPACTHSHTSRRQTQHDKSSACLGISEQSVKPYRFPWCDYMSDILTHLHTLSNNLISSPDFNMDLSGALGMPGHRCLLTASSGGGSQKHSQKRRASAQCGQRMQPEVSTGQHTGAAHSPNNKQNKRQEFISQLQTFSECL